MYLTWNPVKELKETDSYVQVDHFLADMWNPVKELKVCLFSVTHLLVRQRKWNPVKELKGLGLMTTKWRYSLIVESGEGIESQTGGHAPS